MIGWLHGQIIDRHQPGRLVIDVQGVGYDVETSLQTFFQVEALTHPVGLHIHTVVREDALLLYGFLEKDERALFRALIKVNGVGPKMAMTILSSITPQEFIQCIHQQNALLLTRLPGIGKKTAERLVVEMKDSIHHLTQNSTSSIADPKVILIQAQEEAINALISLGYKPQEAMKTAQKVDDGSLSCEQIIRKALQVLSKVN